MHKTGIWIRRVAIFVASLGALCLLAFLLQKMLFRTPPSPTAGETAYHILDNFDSHITATVEDTLSDIVPIRWIWTLSDEDLIAPEPDPACSGTTDDPSTLDWLLEEARQTLGVETTCFSTSVTLAPEASVSYYLDKSILAISWKEIRNGAVYTISEVKIAHASQFRRYLTDGVYGSKTVENPSDMAIAVNAVTASSGDFYSFRDWGVNTYQGTVYNVKTIVDSCFITESGDLLFTRAGELSTMEQAQQFVDENHVRFSLAFGPVLVEDGKNVVPANYPLGEIRDHYSRTALCQVDSLHYLLVVANSKPGGSSVPTSSEFAQELILLGVDKAFSLDGGQSGAIITNGRLINRPDFGYQRQLSDIIYFATAIPEERWKGK